MLENNVLAPILKKSAFVSLLVLSLPLEAFFSPSKTSESAEIKPQENCGTTPSSYRASTRHVEGKGIGYTKGYTSVDLFIAPPPTIPHRWVPFFDTRLHVFDNGKIATNVGIGVRYIASSFVYGVNSYYDYRQTNRQKYNQYSLGFEALGKVWDFRLNGYLPVGNKKSPFYETQFSYFLGHQIILSQMQEFAMKGLNAEAGIHIKKMKDMQFYGAFGPYYFEKAGKNAIGGKARISAIFLDHIKAELSTSYDPIFHWIGQAELSLVITFGPHKKIQHKKDCTRSLRLKERALQPVDRQEIIVVDNKKTNPVAINPTTGLPYFVVFVDNTSHSLGTYESPYPTLALAQENSAPNDILYIFPGDGTTTGMDSGITLQNAQKFWGSGTNQYLHTEQGNITIPAHTSRSPTITNTNIDTLGNAITLAKNNAISGFTIDSAMNDAIHGDDVQNLSVSSCTFTNTTTFVINTTSSDDASISLINNQFVNNTNGVLLTFHGTSTFIASNNTFTGTSSASEAPLHVAAYANPLFATVKDNTFSDNVWGGIQCDLNSTDDAQLTITNNIFNHNGFGGGVGNAAALYINSGTSGSCDVVFSNNTISGNYHPALHIANGSFTDLQATISGNTITDNGGGLGFVNECTLLTLIAANNTISENRNHAIAIGAGGVTIDTANITISNNHMNANTNSANGIVLSNAITTVNLIARNNEISGNNGSGITLYCSPPISNATVEIENNVINNNQNAGTNGTGGIDLQQMTNLVATITNNTLLGNAGSGMAVNSYPSISSSICLQMGGNNCDNTPDSYILIKDGVFNLAPCDVDAVNTGFINKSGDITPVQSCPDASICPPSL